MAPRNKVLCALPADELLELSKWLRPVELRYQQVLLRPGQPIEGLWFPESCVVSLVIPMPEGREVECGMIGAEGVVGLGGAITGGCSYTRQAVQIGGPALRLSKPRLLQGLRRLPTFVRLLHESHDAFVAHCLQTTACFAIHSAPERLARSLLELSDRACSDELPLTHDVLALTIGGSRQTVTTVLSQLERVGALSTHRNRILLLDKRVIEARACSCYRVAHASAEPFRHPLASR